ncbi:MAG: hypothetical protein AAGI38_05240 [Bacteroidota bacterium]
MKVRFHHSSVRMRLTQSEVAQFQEEGLVLFNLPLLPQSLEVTLQVAAQQNQLTATFDQGKLDIQVPQELGTEWASTSQVSLSTSITVSATDQIELLIEKDFKCLHRDSLEDVDTFPHPNQQVKLN